MMTLGDNESLKIFLNLFQTKDILYLRKLITVKHKVDQINVSSLQIKKVYLSVGTDHKKIHFFYFMNTLTARFSAP